jgi:hypothetical protein
VTVAPPERDAVVRGDEDVAVDEVEKEGMRVTLKAPVELEARAADVAAAGRRSQYVGGLGRVE